MNWRAILALLGVLALGTLVTPTANANVPEVDDDVVILPCNNPGHQGTIATVPIILVTGTGWNPYPYYYVYGTTYYQNVNAYNYCVAGNQVGGVSTGSGGSYSWQTCVNCRIDIESERVLP